MTNDPLGFAGKRVLVTGCASGIGRATAVLLMDFGAEVHGIDRHTPDLKMASFRPVNLGDPGAIDRITFDGDLDALFNCAGLSPTCPPADIVRVNFLGTRLLTERLVPSMAEGGAIVSVSSNGGARWRDRLPVLKNFVGIASFDGGAAWFEAHSASIANAYSFSKEALIVWTMQQSAQLIQDGIRINCTSPGAVQTPMLEEIETRIPAKAIDATTRPIGRRSSANEQAWPIVFLASDAAAYINGVDLAVDGGYAADLVMGPSASS